MTERPTGFYVATADDTRFDTTPAAAGPWDPRVQHGGPPAALLSHAIDRFCGDDGRRTVRFAADLLRPVPVGPVRTDVRRVRSGGRIELVEATLRDDDGTDLVLARAWRFPVADVELPVAAGPAPVPPDSSPDAGTVPPFFPVDHEHGYHYAVEWRFIRGAWCEPGPAFVWMRPRIELVAQAPVSAWEALLLTADSASGASSPLDPARFLFPNVDLSVTTFREPAGDWIGFDTTARFSAAGAGTATATVFDTEGQVGTSTQTLLLRQR